MELNVFPLSPDQERSIGIDNRPAGGRCRQCGAPLTPKGSCSRTVALLAATGRPIAEADGRGTP